jgi:hypothetical protein
LSNFASTQLLDLFRNEDESSILEKEVCEQCKKQDKGNFLFLLVLLRTHFKYVQFHVMSNLQFAKNIDLRILFLTLFYFIYQSS